MDWDWLFAHTTLFLLFAVLPVVYSLLLIADKVPPPDKRLSRNATRVAAWHLLVIGALGGVLSLEGAVSYATQPVLPMPGLMVMRSAIVGVLLGVAIHAIYRIRRERRVRDDS
jgi:hypothetical protein